MALTKIEGKLVDVQISTNLVTPAWKKIVCSTDAGLDGSVDTTTVNTKCGVLKARGNVGWTFTGSGMVNQTPGVNEISATEVATLFQDGTAILVKLAHVTTESIFYRSGQGTISAYSESAGVEDNVGYDFTIEIDGNLDFTA